MTLLALDIDGDGVNELIARRVYDVAFRYEVYNYADGRWKNVFSTWIHSEFSLKQTAKPQVAPTTAGAHDRCFIDRDSA